MCVTCSLQVETLESVADVTLDAGHFPLVGEGGPAPLRSIESRDVLNKDSIEGVPAVLGDVAAGPWRWAGPGLQIASMHSSAGLGEWLYLLRAQPGAKLPKHGHRGAERLVILEGSFTDQGVTLERGDYIEQDTACEHQPVVNDQPCVCLISTDGPLKLKGVARWLQPFLGI
jgi:putative transcriptional regulator